MLEALKRMFFELEDDWTAETAASGEEALARMDQEGQFDVVVTDMRMPGMDGADLLQAMNARHPDVACIVLSGQMSDAAACRAVPFAHRFLAKRCDANTLVDVIQQMYESQSIVEDVAMRRALGAIQGLRARPKHTCHISMVKALLPMLFVVCACASDPSNASSCSTTASSPCEHALIVPAPDRYGVCKAHWADYGDLATFAECQEYSLSAYTSVPCDGYRIAVFHGVDDSVECYFESTSGSLVSIAYNWQCDSCSFGPAAGVPVPVIASCTMQRRYSDSSTCGSKGKDASADADGQADLD